MNRRKWTSSPLGCGAFFSPILLVIYYSLFLGSSPLCAQTNETLPPIPLSGRPLLTQGLSAIPCLGFDFPSSNSAELAFAIDPNQTFHLLWTGRLRDEFNLYAFYSSSTDGNNWAPCQILDYWNAYEPQVVVDSQRGRVHLAYRSNLNHIVHRVVQQGVVSAAVSIDDHTGVVAPSLALEAGSGRLHCVWREGYLYQVDAITFQLRRRTYYSYWNGTSWSTREQIVNNEDTSYSSLATNSGLGLMLAWFQNWAESQPKSSVDPGISISPRTAFSTDGGLTFPVRVGVTSGYSPPQTDDSLLLGYSAADGKFHLLTDHLMWPGHSIVYHYTWDGVGAWSAPEDLGKNPLNWAWPVYIGSSQNNQKTVFIWNAAYQLQMRLQNPSGTYSTVALGSSLAAQGYAISQASYYADNSFLHIIFSGQQGSQSGIFYVKVPIAGTNYTYLPLTKK